LDRRPYIGPVEMGLAVADMGHAAQRPGYLGRDHDLVAGLGRFQPRADIALGPSLRLAARRHRIHLGRVEEIDAALERIAQLLMRLGLAVLLAPGHGAETDAADFDAGTAEGGIFHGKRPVRE